MLNILFNCRWAVKVIACSISAMTKLILCNHAVCAVEIPQPEKFAQKTDEQEPDIELIVIDTLLNQPVFSPFRREGTVKDSTRPVYVITGEEIEAQGARNVREALRFLPGILPDGTVGTEVNALSGQFIRGSNSGQVLILLDGRPINNLGSGSFDLSEITSNIIERIEVLPGGGSTLYGSSAIGGVISIITRRPTEKVTTQAGVTFGAYGLNQQTINNSGKSGDIGWVLGYNRIQAENNYHFAIPEADFEGTRKNNDVLYNNFNVKLEANLGKRNTLILSSLYLGKEQGVPGGVPIPEPLFGQGYFNSLTERDRKYTDQVLTDLTWNSKLGSGNDSLLTAKLYADFLNTRFDSRASSSARFDNEQNSYGIQAQHSWNFAKNQVLVYGFDYRNTSARNSTFNYLTDRKTTSYDDSISQGALFARYEINFTPGFTMNFGLRQDFSSLTNGSFTSPSVGAKLVLTDSTTLRANYIRNFRVPTLFNLYARGSSFVGNPDLKPEKGDSYDIGIDQKLWNFGLLRLTYFSNTISDLIAYNFAVPVGTYENIGLVRTTGIEAVLNVQFAKNFYGFVNYTLNDPRILSSANSAEEGNELRFAGADSLNLGISYETPAGLYAGILMHSLGAYPTNNTNTESLPGYTTFDLKIRVPLSNNFVVTGSVDNIFNQRYQLFPGYPDAGRVFQIGLSSSF
ncbi:TonB-dependent receptor [Fischerella thermalis]|uniref:TonB-dependent receptor n=1 Tax=Fischerella thermalis TaxID=372787 RepID=UPI0019E43AE9|nr:TonB-dependent receptor [Fischerella thermalis]MBF1990213.1 TonB-dependent receptor [Fischerella thermalis M58_A2018_009]MBF2059943.1 TonB-dependent receptor [Fischerella thermalis M66_A2018_004]MBF2072057.1 TonB-dependent receptor [Fischerella thermalis M48_A2018_028]